MLPVPLARVIVSPLACFRSPQLPVAGQLTTKTNDLLDSHHHHQTRRHKPQQPSSLTLHLHLSLGVSYFTGIEKRRQRMGPTNTYLTDPRTTSLALFNGTATTPLKVPFHHHSNRNTQRSSATSLAAYALVGTIA